ncbi:MAG: acyl-ACP--UDP-N-acetylglucosamine O-acyltransferase, partial [Verrucomicrobiota bacterium]
YGPEQRQQIQAAYTTLYDEGLNVGQAVARLKADFPDGPVAQLAAFVEASQRGICLNRPPRRGEAGADED